MKLHTRLFVEIRFSAEHKHYHSSGFIKDSLIDIANRVNLSKLNGKVVDWEIDHGSASIAGFVHSKIEFESNDKTLLPHQNRVITEQQNLLHDIGRLQSFVRSDAFKIVNADEQERLVKQARAMEELRDILQDRIDNF